MNCQEAREYLDDFHDGLLSDEVRMQVREHLSGCLPCKRESLEIENLLARAGRLPAEIEPERDLWPGIRQQIGGDSPVRESAPKPSLLRWAYLAAAAVVALVISFAIVERDAGPGRGSSPVVSREVASPELPVFVEADLARSEDGVLQTRVDLLTVLETRREQLDPRTLADLEANLQLLDLAISEIRQALDEKPGDLWLNHQLAARYRKESALLKRVSRV